MFRSTCIQKQPRYPFGRKDTRMLSKHAVFCVCRGELAADEDLSELSPESLLARKPFLTLVALIAILDPPREEAIRAVKVAHEAGIQVKMITGTSGLLPCMHALSLPHVVSWLQSPPLYLRLALRD